MTIAQIAYIASLHDTAIAVLTTRACAEAAARGGRRGLARMAREFDRYARMGRARFMEEVAHGAAQGR